MASFFACSAPAILLQAKHGRRPAAILVLMLTTLIDRTINVFKWPAAAVSLLLLPTLAPIAWQNISGLATLDWAWFWLGAAGYWVCWKTLFSSRLWGSWLPTFEHELTHAVFAWLTLHRVTEFRTRYSTGGHVAYVGGVGNWLITIAPYFFPTAVFAAMLVMELFPGVDAELYWLGFGAVCGFQAQSTLSETRSEQPDILKTGRLFAVLFLPGANMAVYGGVASWMLGGWPRLHSFTRHVAAEFTGDLRLYADLAGLQI